jgi:flagellar basal body rod protein FlgB
VLAQNVANEDESGYRMRELKEQNFRGMVGGARSAVTMAATNAHHIGAKGGPGGGFKTVVRRDAMKGAGGMLSIRTSNLMLERPVRRGGAIRCCRAITSRSS